MEIPLERLQIRFARSGGPGGQNVNKLDTKAEIRFQLEEAEWIAAPVRARLKVVGRRFLQRDGTLRIVSQRFRSQRRNLTDCVDKLRQLLVEAGRAPKKRRSTRPTRASRERRLEQKSRRSRTKRDRGWRSGD